MQTKVLQTKVVSEDVSLERNAVMVTLVREKTGLSEIVSRAAEALWLRDFYGFEKWIRDFLRLPGAVARAVPRRVDVAEFVNWATLGFGYFVI